MKSFRPMKRFRATPDRTMRKSGRQIIAVAPNEAAAITN